MDYELCQLVGLVECSESTDVFCDYYLDSSKMDSISTHKEHQFLSLLKKIKRSFDRESRSSSSSVTKFVFI